MSRTKPLLFALFAFVCLSMIAPRADAAPFRHGPATSEAASTRCGDLTGVDLTQIGGAGSRVDRAADAAGGQGQPACVVEGHLAPAIGFRVELPLRGWTRRFLQTGCGGLCGNLRIEAGAADGCPVLDAGGFVTASTDMGHEGMDGGFGRDPQKRVDFAYRGVHLTVLAAKALIRAFYGHDAWHSYFDGCSDGGREALVEAQRFPQDFDGIIAGAPAMAFTVQNSIYHGWQARSNTDSAGKPILLAARLPILHAAVLAACDAQDGVKDGLLSAPALCRFDPATILCKLDQATATCLTPAEVEVARRFYAGPRDPATGERLTQGGPQYGSELQWAGVYVPMAADQPIFSAMIVSGAMGNLITPDGQPATASQIGFDRKTFDVIASRHALFDATNPDLSAFRARGGKLILFHGWADPHISPLNTIAYHEAVRRRMGVAAAASFERLYLMPAMGHCSGGEGPSAFDLLTPLVAWVEQGRPPDAIITRAAMPSRFGLPGAGEPGESGGPHGTAPSGPPPSMMPPPIVGPDRSRPVYPYPATAAFTGHGDPNDAANWTRGPDRPAPIPTWAGSWYFAPYAGARDTAPVSNL